MNRMFLRYLEYPMNRMFLHYRCSCTTLCTRRTTCTI
jgi:hypothetical protein